MRDDAEALSRVAIFYYEQNLNQQEIARRMGVSAMTVSRLLERARKHEIVEITIRAPFATVPHLEAGLVERYAVRRAVVLSNPLDRPLPALVAQAAAFYLETHLKDDQVLGIAGGRTVAGIVGALHQSRLDGLHVVQLMGGMGTFAYINPHTILQMACERLRARGTYFDAPAYARNAGLARTLTRDVVHGSALADLWRRCDIAVLGIGNASHTGLYVESGFVSAAEIDAICAAGGIGDLLGRYFTGDGRFLDVSANRRAMAMPIADLRRVPIVLSAAWGRERLPAIRGALRTGCVSVLVTDDETATSLLSADREASE